MREFKHALGSNILMDIAMLSLMLFSSSPFLRKHIMETIIAVSMTAKLLIDNFYFILYVQLNLCRFQTDPALQKDPYFFSSIFFKFQNDE